mgnify:CR=1 FL=1
MINKERGKLKFYKNDIHLFLIFLFNIILIIGQKTKQKILK